MKMSPLCAAVLLALVAGPALADDYGFSPVVPGLLTSVDAAVANARGVGSIGDAFLENSFRTQGWLAYHSLRTTTNPLMADKTISMDTFLRTENLREKTFVQLGDFISQPNALGRSVRLTGVSFGQGMLAPAPLASGYTGIASSSIVPSFVDIFMAQQLLRRPDVDSGALTLSMAGPMAFGDYEVVTKDVLGRKLLVTQKAAHGDRLAGKGKLDYRVDIGGLRQKYGEAEHQVDGTGGIASARYGVTKNFTLGGHVAATPSATSVSISPAYRMGKLGVASGFYEANNRDGYLSGAAFERTTKDYTFGVDYAKSEPGVDTFGFNSSMRAPAERLTVRGSFRVGTGNINVMHVTNEDVRAGYAQLDFVGYTVPVSHGVHLMTNFTRGKVAGQQTDTVYLNLIWQFDTRSYASAYSGTSGKDTVDQVGAARAPGASNGFGYELRHSNGSALDPYSQAKVIHHSDYARLEGQVNNTGGQQLRLKTTAAWTADGVFVRRASSDAFVFAETGLPGATLESSTGRRFSADADGKVLLSGVPANSEQRLTLKGEEGSQEELVVTAPRRGIVKVQADAAKVD